MPIKFHSEIEQYNLKIQKGRLVVAHYRDATLKQTILPGMKFALADFLQLNRANLKKKSGYGGQGSKRRFHIQGFCVITKIKTDPEIQRLISQKKYCLTQFLADRLLFLYQFKKEKCNWETLQKSRKSKLPFFAHRHLNPPKKFN
jgi:hypothetical protein